MLTKDEVLHVAKLAKLHLSEAEVEQYQKDLSGILDWVGVLSEVNTEGVEETSQVTGLENAWREGDEVQIYAQKDALLEQSPHPKRDHMIQIPNIMK